MKKPLTLLLLAIFCTFHAFSQNPILKYFGNKVYSYTPDVLIARDSGTYLMACSGQFNSSSIYLDVGPSGTYSYFLLDQKGDTIWAKQEIDAYSDNTQTYLNDGQDLYTFIRGSTTIGGCNGTYTWLPSLTQTQTYQMNLDGNLGTMKPINIDCHVRFIAAASLNDGKKILINSNNNTPFNFNSTPFGQINILNHDNVVISQKNYSNTIFPNAKIAPRDDCSLMLAHNQGNNLMMSIVNHNGEILETQKYPNAIPYKLLHLPTGGFMLLAKENSKAPCVMRFNQNGQYLWEKHFTKAVDIVAGAKGTIGLLYNQDGHHIGVMALDTSGNIHSNRTYTLADTLANAYYLTLNHFNSYSIVGTIKYQNSFNVLGSQRSFLLIDTIPIQIPPNNSVNTTLQLKAFEDSNQNCTYDIGETLYPNWQFNIEQPLGSFVVAASSALPIAQGQYSIAPIPPPGQWSLCTSPSSVNIAGDTTLYFGVNPLCQNQFATIDTVMCAGSYYKINGKYYALSGTIVDTLSSVNGCDSIVTVHLTILPKKVTNHNLVFCEGQSVVFEGITYSSPDTIEFHYAASGYCDSLVILRITRHSKLNIRQASICHGESVTIGNSVYNAPGVYQNTYVSSLGCDSIVETRITPKYKLVYQNYYICPGESVQIRNNIYNQTGTHYDTVGAVAGCDTVFISRIYSNQKTKYINTKICQGEIFTVGNSMYNAPGNYRDTLLSINGCDSVIYTQLMFYNTNAFFNQKICPGQIIQNGILSFNAPGTYVDTLSSFMGCDSIVTTSIHWNNATHFINKQLCPSEIFTYKNKTYKAPNIICDTLTSCYGCDSIVYISLLKGSILRNQYIYICPGMSVPVGHSLYTTAGVFYDTLTSYTGCDSIINTNILWRNVTKNISIRLCPGQTYQVGDSIYSKPGSYTTKLKTYLGCDSIVNLSINNYFIKYITLKICPGDTIYPLGLAVTQPSLVFDTLTSIAGCDSILRYNIIWNTKNSYLSVKICPGQTHQVGNSLYSLPGSYKDTFTTYLGCDSIINTTITWNNKSKFKTFAICPNEIVQVGNSFYSQPGSYTDIFSTYLGCDSIVYTTITWRKISSFVNEEICPGSSVWVSGVQYFVPGIYTDTLTSYQGCDSVLYINICYANKFEYDRYENICVGDTITIGNSNYFATGNYTDTLQTFTCDSIIHLHLNVVPVMDQTQEINLCQGDSILIQGIYYHLPGVYTSTLTNSLDCEATLFSTIHVYPAVQHDTIPLALTAGSIFMGNNIFTDTLITLIFQNQTGCDSLITYWIDVVSVTNETIIPFFQVSIQPNPNYGQCSLVITSSNDDLVSVNIFNVLGEKVMIKDNVNIYPGRQNLPLDLMQPMTGLYWVAVQNKSGHLYTQKILIMDK